MVHGGLTMGVVEVETRPPRLGQLPLRHGNSQLQPLPQTILHRRLRVPRPIPLPRRRVPQLILPLPRRRRRLLPFLPPPPLLPPPPFLPLPRTTLVLAWSAGWQCRPGERCLLLMRAIPRTSLLLTTLWSRLASLCLRRGRPGRSNP